MFNIGNHDKIINICICICVFVICICIYWTKQITTYSWIPPGFCCILLIAVDCRWATNNLKGICISICLWKQIANYRIFFNTVRYCLFLAFLLQKFFFHDFQNFVPIDTLYYSYSITSKRKVCSHKKRHTAGVVVAGPRKSFLKGDFS